MIGYTDIKEALSEIVDKYRLLYKPPPMTHVLYWQLACKWCLDDLNVMYPGCSLKLTINIDSSITFKMSFNADNYEFSFYPILFYKPKSER